MPRTLTNQSCVVQNPMCCMPPAPAPAPAPAPQTTLASGGYLEIHGGSVDWRLKVMDDGSLATQQRSGGQWLTKFLFE
jgi:hypothetical protein